MSAAILFADRVKDTTTSTGSSNLTLAGSPPTGYQSFNTAFGTSTYFYYTIEGGAEWEVGKGHLSASTTLVRDTVYASTNSNAAVSFSAGTKNVFCTIPANHAQRTLSAGPLAAPRTSTAQDDEFDGPTINPIWTKTNSATVESYDDHIRSAAYFEHAGSSSDITLSQAYTNAGNFSITCAVNLLMTSNFHNFLMQINDGSTNNIGIQLLYNTGPKIRTMHDSVQDTQATVGILDFPVFYLHTQRTTNNWSCYYSNDCVNWTIVGGAIAETMTVANLALTFGVGASATKCTSVLHWFRRDWLTL